MQYRMLKSIIASKKETKISLSDDSESFFVKRTRVNPYIEPNFSKLDFPDEKPSILLISAIGASGKTTAAQAISFDIQLPILDLAKHKAVGDHTLTGVLTTAYPSNAIGQVLEGLKHGEYGIIIDGIDEGRSKTTEQGFEAFLDDLIQRSSNSAAPTIVAFGRSQVILNAWVYLADKGANVGLVQLDPFSLEQAKKYINLHVGSRYSQVNNYSQVRDIILMKLNSALSAATPKERDDQDPFLSFIGYPPVLDAISTLLEEESNFHRLQQSLQQEAYGQLEIELLVKISEYVLNRERIDKALPNFIDEIANDAGPELGQELRQSLYISEEQCARVLSRTLRREFPRQIVQDDSLNERYENAVDEWFNDHPFLEENRVRNVVFAAYAFTRCAVSNIPEYRNLAYLYVANHQPTYHFLYIFYELASDVVVEARYFNTLIQSVSESVGVKANISTEIAGTAWEDASEHELQQVDARVDLIITVEFPDKGKERTFEFEGKIGSAESIPVGPYLVNANVTLPYAVHLIGGFGIEAMGSCNISARRVSISTSALTLSPIGRKSSGMGTELFVDAHTIEGHVGEVSSSAGQIEIRCVDHQLAYPLAKYVKTYVGPTVIPISDPNLKEIYRRLRRILSEFASHKKGGLAKYRQKIEHDRVLRGEIGRRVLDALLSEKILWKGKDQKFYHINMDEFSEKLGISWHQIRRYEISDRLEEFLRKI